MAVFARLKRIGVSHQMPFVAVSNNQVVNFKLIGRKSRCRFAVVVERCKIKPFKKLFKVGVDRGRVFLKIVVEIFKKLGSCIGQKRIVIHYILQKNLERKRNEKLGSLISKKSEIRSQIEQPTTFRYLNSDF